MFEVFNFQLPKKIIFGNDAIHQLGSELKSLNVQKPLIVTDPCIVKAGILKDALSSLKESRYEYDIFDKVEPDSPIRIVDECTLKAKDGGFDALIGIGGGSVMDTAKAVSVMVTNGGSVTDCAGIDTVKKAGIVKILIPTTAGTGSDLSNALVLKNEETKDKLVSYSKFHFADVSLIDPILTLNLPQKQTAECGIDAFSHALESYVAIRANPFSETLAIKGIEYVSQYLRPAYAKGRRKKEARYYMCLGVCMGTMGLRSSGSGALHAVGYPVAAKARLSHGESLAIMMPHVMEYNMVSNLSKFAKIAEAMGEKIDGLSAYQAAMKSIEAVRALIRDINLPVRLRDVGIKQSDFNDFAETVLKNSQYLLENNPRDLTKEDLKTLYMSAY